MNAKLSAAERRLIEEAVAAGRVTVVPTGYAAGLTRLESVFHTAGPNAAAKTLDYRASTLRGSRNGLVSQASSGRHRK